MVLHCFRSCFQRILRTVTHLALGSRCRENLPNSFLVFDVDTLYSAIGENLVLSVNFWVFAGTISVIRSVTEYRHDCRRSYLIFVFLKRAVQEVGTENSLKDIQQRAPHVRTHWFLAVMSVALVGQKVHCDTLRSRSLYVIITPSFVWSNPKARNLVSMLCKRSSRDVVNSAALAWLQFTHFSGQHFVSILPYVRNTSVCNSTNLCFLAACSVRGRRAMHVSTVVSLPALRVDEKRRHTRGCRASGGVSPRCVVHALSGAARSG